MSLVILFASCSNAKKVTGDSPAGLDGNWELTYITGPRIAFDGLYPEKKPTIRFDTQKLALGGHNSCNSYGGSFTLDGQKISFGNMHSTLIACNGSGEATFMKALKEVNAFALEGEEILVLLRDDIPFMKFRKLK